MNSTFECIGSIDTAHAASWEGKIFLSFDIDWASDEVLTDTIDLVEEAGVAATWFVTHDTPLLARLRANPKFELGIHPNFNQLLFEASDANGHNAENIVARLMRPVPEARCVRSHSVTQSSRLLETFRKNGLTYHCNTFVPLDSGIRLAPWRLWNDMTEVPYGWADDAQFVYGWKLTRPKPSDCGALSVFAFHPVHVALNSTDSTAYERSRSVLSDFAQLKKRCCPGFGVRSQLEDLLGRAR